MSGVVRGRLAFFVFLLAVGCIKHDVGVLTQAHTARPAKIFVPILGLVVFLRVGPNLRLENESIM
jgi:hypothetical protein